VRKFIFLVILFCFMGCGKSQDLSAHSRLIGIVEVAKNNRISLSEVGFRTHFCLSESAIRTYSTGSTGKNIMYSNIVWYIDDQLGNPGKFSVSAETKCFAGSIPDKLTGGKWRYASFYHPLPELIEFSAYVVNRHNSANPWCVAKKVGKSYNYTRTSFGWAWKEKIAEGVIFKIPQRSYPDTGAFYEEFPVPYDSFQVLFVSRDLQCFGSMEKASKAFPKSKLTLVDLKNW